MNPCMLPATGLDGSGLLLVAGAALAAGTAAVVLARGRSRSGAEEGTRSRRGATVTALVALPLAVGLLLGTGGSAAPASAAACPPAASPVSPGVVFSPGASGIGDPYYPLDGNGGYDVLDYDLDLGFDPASDVLSGTAAIELTATQNLSAFNLDFDTRTADGVDSIDISAVRLDGAAVPFSLATTQISGDTAQPLADVAGAGVEAPRTELTVTPGAGIAAGRTVVVEVDYAGVPVLIDDAFGAAGVFQTDDGMVIVGQPRVAATWFPANDHPADKATMTMSMTVPDGLEVIGNGELLPLESGAGSTTWTYVMDRPIATYLATATVGEYDIVTTQVGGVTYRDAVAESLFSSGTDGVDSRAALALNPDVIAYLSQLFGPYPFTESGGIAVDVPALGFALENQTRPIYSGKPDEATIVHELAHQWYGDDVAISRWSDIWLNEGFATYAEWLWDEEQGGRTTQQYFDDLYAEPADDDFWAGIVADPGPAGIFDGFVYNRGAMALHALRVEVGDDGFRQILLGWAGDNSGGTVTTAQFEAYASSVAGRDLTALFDTWIHTGEKPAAGADLGCGSNPLLRC